MGHRLSKITTRTGDKGMTGLATGVRVEKDSPRERGSRRGWQESRSATSGTWSRWARGCWS